MEISLAWNLAQAPPSLNSAPEKHLCELLWAFWSWARQKAWTKTASVRGTKSSFKKAKLNTVSPVSLSIAGKQGDSGDSVEQVGHLLVKHRPLPPHPQLCVVSPWELCGQLGQERQRLTNSHTPCEC